MYACPIMRYCIRAQCWMYHHVPLYIIRRDGFKPWTIPHGGGGPGDAIVGVSERLLPYIPGTQIKKTSDGFEFYKTFNLQ